jgi:8-oxo-dGTP pyrophosphatase MutT (NUDIX family)
MYVNARAIIERETEAGTEILLQVATRQGLAPSLEFPGGRLEEFEPILSALAREVQEETGLTLTRILGQTARVVSESFDADVDCLLPFFGTRPRVVPSIRWASFFDVRPRAISPKMGMMPRITDGSPYRRPKRCLPKPRHSSTG